MIKIRTHGRGRLFRDLIRGMDGWGMFPARVRGVLPKCKGKWRRHKWNPAGICSRCWKKRNPAAAGRMLEERKRQVFFEQVEHEKYFRELKAKLR